VFLEHNSPRSHENYHSLLKVTAVDEESETIEVAVGNFLTTPNET